jgi:DNA-binding FrmR family transcriptional regulator
MKAQLRKIIRAIAGWPVIGRIVRIGVAVIRLPEFRTAFLDLNGRQHLFETQQLPALQQTLSDLNGRQHLFETQQLPTLLQTLSDLNHRQLASDNDRDNLVKSVPVALRKITRDLVDIRGQLDNVSNSMEQRISETQGQLESVSNSMEQRISETKEQLESVSNSMEQRISETQGQLGSVSNSMEQRLSETKEQLESVSNSVGYLLGRVEFVRRELMFEMRYGASIPAGEGDQIKTKTEIISPEKLAAAKNAQVRLNLGCGHIPLEGYLNVDRRPLPGVDIVAEVDELPFEQGEVDEIFSAHLLEHFPQEQLRRELLPYFFNLLKEGGEFHAVVPDAEAMIREYSNGHYPYDDMREVFYGAQDYDGDFHFNMFTPDALSELLLEAGFTNISILERGRKNGSCYEFEIRGIKT